MPAEAEAIRYPTLFSPIRVGTMALRNRVMIPPHAAAIGNLWGSQRQADRHVAYWAARASEGAAWIDGISGLIDNRVIPGFDPTGVGAVTSGWFRLPFFVDRAGQLAAAVHSAGASATAQLVHQGGMPHAPSATPSSPVNSSVPHVLDTDEIRWFVREYRFSAEQAQRAGLDGVELHANHDDLIEWFLSPLTNQRTDEYGGSVGNRLRFAVQILEEIRDGVGGDFTVGVRMNLWEDVPGGYDLPAGVDLAQRLAGTGLVDFLHVVVGTPWGNPSYIQPHFYEPAAWAAGAGEVRAAVDVPVVHTGRITTPAVAEDVLAAGHADLVGMARAHIADPDLLAKARAGREDEIRPCVGVNECISRTLVEGIRFGCAVNPHVGSEVDGPPPAPPRRKRVLVVGGGPAGMELAALARERGHDVALWEREGALGGQVRIAAAAPRHGELLDYVAWQERRLHRLGVDVALEREATAVQVAVAGADVVAVATGALPRRPPIAGTDLPFVHDIRDVLASRATPGRQVAVVVQDDHMPPLALADFLSERGHAVTLLYPTAGPAPLVGRYVLGAILGRLGQRDVTFRFMEQVTAIAADGLRTRHVYSGREGAASGFDDVVLACGGVPDSALHAALKGRVPELHVLGDAYAPRRIVFATKQAHALAQRL